MLKNERIAFHRQKNNGKTQKYELHVGKNQ